MSSKTPFILKTKQKDTAVSLCVSIPSKLLTEVLEKGRGSTRSDKIRYYLKLGLQKEQEATQ